MKLIRYWAAASVAAAVAVSSVSAGPVVNCWQSGCAKTVNGTGFTLVRSTDKVVLTVKVPAGMKVLSNKGVQPLSAIKPGSIVSVNCRADGATTFTASTILLLN